VATTLRSGRGMRDTDSEKSGLFRDAGDGPVPVRGGTPAAGGGRLAAGFDGGTRRAWRCADAGFSLRAAGVAGPRLRSGGGGKLWVVRRLVRPLELGLPSHS
jgi:hypothetical protein